MREMEKRAKPLQALLFLGELLINLYTIPVAAMLAKL